MLNHEAMQGSQPLILPESGTDNATAAANANFDPISSSICEWTQPLVLHPEEHMKAVVFTLDPTTLASTVQVWVF